MSKLISVVGASGIGKTTLVRGLEHAYPFQTAYEQHQERPFQTLFKQDPRYALANQMDYLLLRAEQEHELRHSPKLGLIDGGLDLDFHGFSRLFHARGLLTDIEYELCRRFYSWTRGLLPLPDLIVHLIAQDKVIETRLSQRERINIATAADIELFNSFLDEWLDSLPRHRILRLDVSTEGPGYSLSIQKILKEIPGLEARY
jgi:deoxyadenosine/deoxycytidine kinase